MVIWMIKIIGRYEFSLTNSGGGRIYIHNENKSILKFIFSNGVKELTLQQKAGELAPTVYYFSDNYIIEDKYMELDSEYWDYEKDYTPKQVKDFITQLTMDTNYSIVIMEYLQEPPWIPLSKIKNKPDIIDK